MVDCCRRLDVAPREGAESVRGSAANRCLTDRETQPQQTAPLGTLPPGSITTSRMVGGDPGYKFRDSPDPTVWALAVGSTRQGRQCNKADERVGPQTPFSIGRAAAHQ